MKRFYASFAILLLTASGSLTALLSIAARMRGSEHTIVASSLAGVSFLLLLVSTMLLVRIMIALAHPAASVGTSGEGGRP